MTSIITSSSFSQNLFALLPESPSGWKVQEEDKLYNIESLYEYINGGAELYISYGMNEVISRFITNKDGDEIRMEIFDMTEAKNAFGVFTHTRTKDEGVYGQGSQYFPGTQIFWKGKYFISVMATDENENIKSAISDLSSKIDKIITETGEIPDIVNLLPKENLEKDAFVYFHHYIWLNSYYFIANDNFLNIDKHTNAILAKYGNKGSRDYLLVIEYINFGGASTALAAFKENMLNPQTEETVLQIEDGSWLGGIAKGNYLICAFNASSKSDIDNLLEKTSNNTQP